MQILKVWVQRWSSSLTSQNLRDVFRAVEDCTRGGSYREVVFQSLLPILMCIFFLCAWCVGVTQLVFGFLVEDCSKGSCRFGMFVGARKLRILVCGHLEPELPWIAFFTFNWKYCSWSSIEGLHLCYFSPDILPQRREFSEYLLWKHQLKRKRTT